MKGGGAAAAALTAVVCSLPETLWCLLLLGGVFHTSVTAAPQGICGWEYIAPALPGGSVDPFLGREGCQKTVLLEEQA